MDGMFFTYIWRELRRRMRQAVLIALGLALGVGLVITVTAASNGVKDSQATVLHTLYGVGTDITVTQPPAKGSGGGTSFGFRQEIKNVRSGQIAAGTKININHCPFVTHTSFIESHYEKFFLSCCFDPCRCHCRHFQPL